MMNKLILVTSCGLLLLFGAATPAPSQDGGKEPCCRWRTQVDVKLDRIDIDLEKLGDEEVISGIDCLLRLSGNSGQARFAGYTRGSLHASGRQPKIKRPGTIEIAALYYVSYVFKKNWEHAGSVQLYDPEQEKANTRSNVRRAFESYRKWFEKVKRIGLQKAREDKLDPLDGSGIQWS